MSKITFFFAHLALCLQLANCTTLTGTASFDDLALGMTKGEVLELMGSPAVTARKQSIDYWYYYLSPGDRLKKRALHFDDGRLIYFGHPVPPAISAEKADWLKENPGSMSDTNYRKSKRRYSDKELRRILKNEVMEKDKSFKPAEN